MIFRTFLHHLTSHSSDLMQFLCHVCRTLCVIKCTRVSIVGESVIHPINYHQREAAHKMVL